MPQSKTKRLVTEASLRDQIDARVVVPPTPALYTLSHPLTSDGDNFPQSFSVEQTTGDIYCAFAVDATNPTRQDMTIMRYNSAGVFQDKATLIGAGHGDNIVAEYDSGNVYIWFWWEVDTTGNSTAGPVRFKYSGSTSGTQGRTVLRTDSDVKTLVDLWNTKVVFSIDPAIDRLAVHRAGSTTCTVQLRSLSEYKAGTDNVLISLPYSTPANMAFQGLQSADTDLYVWRGGAYNVGVPTVYRYSWLSGSTQTPGIADVSAVNVDPDGNRYGTNNEAEGMSLMRDSQGLPIVLLGMTQGSKGVRKQSIRKLSWPGQDALTYFTLRRMEMRIQSGSVLITPVANTPTKYTITFPFPFPRTPQGFVTANTSVPGTQVTGASFANISPTGMDLYLTRNNTNVTSVHWQAVCP